MDLSGKNILVTGGGGSGIGAGICKILTRSGANVLLNERYFEDAEKAAQNYPRAIPFAADISISAEVDQMFDDIRQTAGDVHGLVNNAGVGLSKLAHLASEEEFSRLFNTDMKGLWLVSKAFANQLINSRQAGNIVNISSVHSKATIARYAIYASTKSAVEGLTRGMAVELGQYNIRVNAVAPAYVNSQQNLCLIKTWTDDPQQWVRDMVADQQVLSFEITPEDCGNVTAFLLSDLSRAITGQTIYVDNGNTSLLFNRKFTETDM